MNINGMSKIIDLQRLIMSEYFAFPITLKTADPTKTMALDIKNIAIK